VKRKELLITVLLLSIIGIQIYSLNNSKSETVKIIQQIENTPGTPETQNTPERNVTIKTRKEIMSKTIDELINEKQQYMEIVGEYKIMYNFMPAKQSMYNQDTYTLVIYNKNKVSPSDKPLHVVQGLYEQEFRDNLNKLPAEFDFLKGGK
jgi:hypothetical protein